MRGWVSALVTSAALCAAVAAVGEPPVARAGHQAQNCGIISEGSRDYRVRAQNLGCAKAVRGAKRYLRSGEELDGFSCAEPAGRIDFFCKNGTKVYLAVRL